MLRRDAKLLAVCFSVWLVMAGTALAQGALVFPVPSTCSTLTGTTSPCTLLPAATNLPYTTTLSVSGGAQPYTWKLVSGTLPIGMTLNQNTGALFAQNLTSTGGNTALQISVTDSNGLTTSANFILPVYTGLASVARTGVLPQVAFGAGWGTTIYLNNTTGAVASAQILFRDSNANPMPVPVQSTQPGFSAIASTATTLNFVIPANATVIVQNTNSSANTLLQGWADVLTTGGVGAFAVFRQSFPAGALPNVFPNGGFTEGVAQQGQFSATVTLPYDNTNGVVTAVALASISNLPPNVTATIYDAGGAASPCALPTTLVTLGRVAFTLPDNCPASANTRGYVVFQNMNNVNGQGALSGLALNFNSGVFVSFPAIASATQQ
ncbi:MAG TPA: putative Ig domain-containing protein [Bryobacteraceae bacterium]|nr:putative Ig domain-containing protein [Bryobacteraceae bacterium]